MLREGLVLPAQHLENYEKLNITRISQIAQLCLKSLIQLKQAIIININNINNINNNNNNNNNNNLSIYIPWPFPPVWGVADNTGQTTFVLSLRNFMQEEGIPSPLTLSLLVAFYDTKRIRLAIIIIMATAKSIIL